MLIEELVSLNPSALIELFILDVSELTAIEGTNPPEEKEFRFYNGSMSEIEDIIYWQGVPYNPFPIEVNGYETDGSKQSPRPTLTVSNLDIIIPQLIIAYDDLLGARVIRKRTFAKFMDNENFCIDNPCADPTQELPFTVFYVNKKISESIDIVSFELSNLWDIEGLKLPRRVMTSNTCSWKYRDSPCSYSGTNYWDYNNNPVGTLEEDVCGKKLSSCNLRFPEPSVLPFGAFPAIKTR